MTPINKLSLRTRIFIAMIFIVVIASILIAAVTIYQFNEQAEDYHIKRLERKEEAIKSAIAYELLRDSIDAFETVSLPIILEKKLNEISDIHNLDINIYNLKGELLKSSFGENPTDTTDANLSGDIMKRIIFNPDHRLVVQKSSADGTKFKSSFSYLIGSYDQEIGIIGVPYKQDNTFQERELKEFLERLSVVYLLIFLIGIVLAYFLSKYITKSLENVSRRMRQTTVEKTNEKIILNDASQEILNLVDSYNSMIDEIEDSAVKLAQSERKHAWREMAKQVAHEIKNPLTPMRLTVQSFAHSFDPNDPDFKSKLQEFCDTLIQQIDIMSEIASAFSNFAEMPTANKEKLNIVEEVKKALDIFHEPYIRYHPEKKEITSRMDKIQLTRIVTNLVTNAIHALENTEDPKIDVRVYENGQEVYIEVEDNGKGIGKEDASKIFEPKFTTKSSGMGLGLPMVKNIVEAYNGQISFTSGKKERTVFSVSLPKDNQI
ncbi:GHKL domain-containing protein [Lutimonas saemankumensis]|uniref:sensor histidine kinase n=1 Tax=Lutimonas saemankumensis TaxID=483016 RepID=UPI001CD57A8C|nr:ATP-binding protein [Lutimonas saemankumensis]MCA0932556.1 GHKL domain-containing protein [Lutimonas saemankumensis]